jgi:Na+(H+)/acetate symporter ActP
VKPVRPVTGAPVEEKTSAVPGGTEPESVNVTVAVLGWPTATVVGLTMMPVVLVRGFTVSLIADEPLPTCRLSP